MPRTVIPLDIALRLEAEGDPTFIPEAERTGAHVRLPKRMTPRELLALDTSKDPNELIKHRFLCRGGALLNVGPTGVGKSSLIMQMGAAWALGRDFFGLTPARSLKSIFIQAENDDMDMAEMLQGVLASFTELSDMDRETISASLGFYREDSRTGDAFVKILEDILKETMADLAFVDPAYAYYGGNVSDQLTVTSFLRNKVQPLLNRSGAALIINHHSNKPPTGKEKPSWRNNDFAYLGSGSSEWANWARAVMGLVTTDVYSVYRLILGKRGSRVGWRDLQGLPVIEKYIAHAREAGRICWREADLAEIEEAGGKAVADYQLLVDILGQGSMPKAELVQKLKDRKISKSSAYRLIAGAFTAHIIVEGEKGIRGTGKLMPKAQPEDDDEY